MVDISIDKIPRLKSVQSPQPENIKFSFQDGRNEKIERTPS